MKKPLIAVAVSMALAATAQAESQFYGKMNVAVGYVDAGDLAPTPGQYFKLQDNASRLGIKGSDDLGTSKVIYQAEFGLPVDNGGLTGRDTYLGLEYGDLGTVKMGYMDTPLKKSQGKFDLFNDVIDMNNIIYGENRMGNSVNYTTPKMGAVEASVSVILPDQDATEGVSASVTYSQDSIYASVAYDSKVKTVDSIVRATVIYNMGGLSFGALVNQVDNPAVSAADDLAYAVNASMKAGNNTYKVQFEVGDQGKVLDNGALGGQNILVGVDHKLAKATKAYVYANMLDTDVDDTDVTQIFAGLEHKF